MIAIDFPEANRTFGKPDSMTDEECSSLRVLDTGQTLVSVWVLNEEERRAIAAGAPVMLSVFGRVHPVVALGVRKLAPAAEAEPRDGARILRLPLPPRDDVSDR